MGRESGGRAINTVALYVQLPVWWPSSNQDPRYQQRRTVRHKLATDSSDEVRYDLPVGTSKARGVHLGADRASRSRCATEYNQAAEQKRSKGASPSHAANLALACFGNQ